MAGILQAPTQAPTPAPTLPPVPKAAQASFTPASASTYTTRDATASFADSTGYEATKQNVSDTSLVQNQLKGILSAGSPLMDLAESRANREANRRGILNSSIAVGAGQKALYESALPIAQQDAATFGTKDVNDAAYTNRASEFTAGAKNTASLTNANLGTQVNLSNATEANRAAAQNAALATDVSKYNTGLGSQTSQFNAGAQNQFAQTAQQGAIQDRLAQIQANTSLSIADKQAASQRVLAEMDNATRVQLQRIQSDTSMSVAEKQAQSQQLIAERNNATNLAISGNDNLTKQMLQSMDAASKLSLANIDAGTKLAVAGLDASTKEKITKMESDNRQILQTNINAANMYAQYVTNLANISINDKMDGAAKQQAADNQLNALNAALRAQGHVSGLDLSQYFQPATNNAGTGAGTSSGFTSGSEAPAVPTTNFDTPLFDYRRT